MNTMYNTQRNWLSRAIMIGSMVAVGSGISYWHLKKEPVDANKPYVIYEVGDDERDINDILQLFQDELYALTTADYEDVYNKLMRRSYDVHDPSKDGSMPYYIMREKGTDKFMGFVAIHRLNFMKGKILFLAVKPEFRGRRLAGDFVKFAFKKFKEMGMKKGMLTTRVDNKSAQRAYEREGFKQYAVHDGFVYYEIYV